MPAITRTHNHFQHAIARLLTKLKKGVDYRRATLIEMACDQGLIKTDDISRSNFWKALVNSDTMYQVVHGWWTLRHKGPRRTSLREPTDIKTLTKVPLVEFEPLPGGFVEIYIDGKKTVVVNAA